LVELSERLCSEMTLANKAYHDVFTQILKLDYHSYVYHVIAANLARDTSEAMDGINKVLAENESKQ